MTKTQSARTLVLTSLTFIATSLSAASIPDDAKIGGFAVGCQAWTWNRFTVFEAIEKTAQTGSKVIEFFPGQRLSKEQLEVKFDHNASDEVLAQVKAKLAREGVRAVNYGVVGAPDEAAWRKIFEFAKKLGLYAVTTEDVDKLDLIEKLVKEYDIRVGIHNHPRQPRNENYKVWNPEYVLSIVKERDTRIGASADLGHWATSGITPLDGLKALKNRVVSLHLKDRTAVGKETVDVPFGAGISNIRGVLDELKREGFAGNISIEYETNWENSVPDVAQCIGFFRGYGGCE